MSPNKHYQVQAERRMGRATRVLFASFIGTMLFVGLALYFSDVPTAHAQVAGPTTRTPRLTVGPGPLIVNGESTFNDFVTFTGGCDGCGGSVDSFDFAFASIYDTVPGGTQFGLLRGLTGSPNTVVLGSINGADTIIQAFDSGNVGILGAQVSAEATGILTIAAGNSDVTLTDTTAVITSASITADGNFTVTGTCTGCGAGAPTDATYITQTSNSSLSNEQALSALSTGLVKVTTTTGVLSTAVSGTDYAPASAAQTTGNFTATYVTGFTTNVTQVINYVLDGSVVTLRFTAGASGTSDSTQFVTAAGDVPASLRPAANLNIRGFNATDNGASIEACLRINTDGSIGWYAVSAPGATCAQSGWTASGTKTMPVSVNTNVATYPLN